MRLNEYPQVIKKKIMIIARTVIFLHTRELTPPTTLSYGCRAIFPTHLIKWLHISNFQTKVTNSSFF